MAPRAPGTQHRRTTSQSSVKTDVTSKSVETNRNESSNGEIDKERRLQLARNIDMVVFGDIAFRSWYPSWYPKEIIGEQALIGESKGIVVERLNICPKCFAYSKEMVSWLQHVKCCERSVKGVPGNLIYTHPGGKGKGIKPVWSVWEVDGEVDTVRIYLLSLAVVKSRELTVAFANSYSARDCRSSPSCSLTTSQYFLMSLALITFFSYIRTKCLVFNRLLVSLVKRRCHGITIILHVSSSFLPGKGKVSVQF